MEQYIYEKWPRRIGYLIGGAYLIPVLGLSATIASDGHGIPNDLIIINVVFTVIAITLGGFLQAAMSKRVKIDVAEGKVTYAYTLLGRTVRRTETPLSQFERISLHRMYRGGYRASLIGRDKEAPLAVSTDLGRVRAVAEEAAALTKLKLTDNL